MSNKLVNDKNTITDSETGSDPFTQLVVWSGTTLDGSSEDELVQFMLKQIGVRIKFEGIVETLPGNGGEGGRSDLFFYVHSDDLAQFSIARFMLGGARWWEDIFYNDQQYIYPIEWIDKHQPTW